MTSGLARLVLLGFGLLLLNETQVSGSCSNMDDQPLSLFAPTLEINILEFPNEDVLPTGYNVTITCISNFSKADWGNRYYAQPYWIQHFFNDDYIGYCGGGDGDSEDSKVCKFVIQNSTEGDSGNYSCITRNQLSCTYGRIPLKFEKPSPPKFVLTPPLHINISSGRTVNLSCEARAIPRPVVMWYKDGRPVSRDSIADVNGISLLTLKNVGPRDQGEYWCEAQNKEGRKRSSRTSLKMLSKPTILRHPQNVSDELENIATVVIFTCQASGFPPPVITWVKNNLAVTSGTVVQNGSTSSLVLRSLDRKETPGSYKCVAKNSLGEVSSEEAELVIRTRTHSLDTFVRERTFYLHPKNVEASRGDDVAFLCAVQGSPVPKIKWLKDGIETVYGQADYVKENARATSVLRILSVTQIHQGRYACKATSPKGNVTSKGAILSIKVDNSTSTGVSKALWISIAAGSAILLVMVISICLVHSKRNKANYEVSKEINYDQQFPHLHIKEGANRQLREDPATPRYQMTNMATEIL